MSWTNQTVPVEASRSPTTHFDPKSLFRMTFHDRYGKMIGPVRELRDFVGGSNPSHASKTLEYNAEGPLPEPVVQAFDDCYFKIKARLVNYYHNPTWYDPEKHGY
ncbi:hypothetical protein D9758_010332 [Tetrapyrgos nigripes]|uniref:Uncharacterized protein n=1 Tax=Tetrapyrgos nigripes TaxID=182062 RepID=A0A8H5FVZ3_9AGAR|nr:hypothetical protein D9758_010332 [Tetrapyrgos nigripes]